MALPKKDDPVVERLDREFIEITVSHLRARVAELQEKRDAARRWFEESDQQIARDIAECAEQLRQWAKILTAEPDAKTLPPPPPLQSAAARVLHEFFDKHPGRGFTWSELARTTGVPLPTVRDVMLNVGSDFECRGENQWFRKSRPAIELPVPEEPPVAQSFPASTQDVAGLVRFEGVDASPSSMPSTAPDLIPPPGEQN